MENTAPEKKKPKKRTRQTKPYWPERILVGLIVLCCCFSWAQDSYLPALAVAICSLGGMILCMSIILHLAGNDNGITRQFCSTKGKFNCDEVLERGSLWKGVSLADFGLIYFCWQFLFLWLAAATHSAKAGLSLLFFPAAGAVALTIALLVYQGMVIHRWCRMCLLVTGVLWVQFIAFIWTIARTGWSPRTGDEPPSLPYLLSASCCVAASWIFFKQWLLKAEQNKKIRVVLDKWKKNPDLFWALIKEQRPVQGAKRWEQELILGDPQAAAQLLCVMNPYCKACAREYPLLDHLLRKAEGHVGLTIRFHLKTADLPDQRARAVKEILQTFFAYTDPLDRSRLLTDWFRWRNLGSWKKKWPVKGEKIGKDLLDKHREWCEENHIMMTPLYFLNGREIPDVYRLSDLTFHLSRPHLPSP